MQKKEWEDLCMLYFLLKLLCETSGLRKVAFAMFTGIMLKKIMFMLQFLLMIALVWNLGMVFIYSFLEIIAALISASYEY